VAIVVLRTSTSATRAPVRATCSRCSASSGSAAERQGRDDAGRACRGVGQPARHVGRLVIAAERAREVALAAKRIAGRMQRIALLERPSG
jgi:hypothetical protein